MRHKRGTLTAPPPAGYIALKKKTQRYLLKHSKQVFMPDHCSRSRDHCTGVLQWGEEMVLNPESGTGKWEFIEKEQRGQSVDGKLLRGNIMGKEDSD